MKAIFITVRSGSSRLPAKALMKINNLATIEHLICRVKQSKKYDKIVVCTTFCKSDDEICSLAEKHGVNFFRGSIKDKLDRCLGAAKHYNIDFFVNVDGDDLFCEPELIDLAFEQHEIEDDDYIKSDEKNLVCGAFTYGIKTKILEEICNRKETDDTEAAWLFFEEETFFKTSMLKNIPDVFYRPEIRATLDYEEDLKFFATIINNLKEGFSLRDVIQYVDCNPDVLTINKHRHEDYLKNQKRIMKKYRSKNV